MVWVRVDDGTLYPARLLVDINAPGAVRPSGAPQGLDDLFEQKWPVGTVLTRAQLEQARGGPYLGES